MHLRYDVIAEDATLRINRLQAHWELPSMVRQWLRSGWPGIVEATKLTPNPEQSHTAALSQKAGPPDFSTLSWSKLLSADNTVTATIELCGARGTALLDFTYGRRRVSRARFFLPN